MTDQAKQPNLADMLHMLRAIYPDADDEFREYIARTSPDFIGRILAERDRHAAEAVGAALTVQAEKFEGSKFKGSSLIAAAFRSAITFDQSTALSARLAQARNEV